MRQRLTAAAGLLGAALLTGCGGSDDPEPANGTNPPTTTAQACSDTAVTTPPAAAASPPAILQVDRVFPALTFDRPLGLVQAPGDDDHWYVVEQPGRILRFDNAPGASTTETVLDLSADAADPADRRVDSGGEKGLFALVFHPDFPVDDRAFLSYTGFGAGATRPRSVLASIRSPDGGRSLDPASLTILLSLDQPFANHNGGHIAFGPDRRLYLGLGDGGSSGDPLGNGQNCDTLLGAILRIDVDATPAGGGYAIPPGNPFAAGGGRPELFAWGFRNPWRWSFDRASGQLWFGDVGQNAFEEVGMAGCGDNHGWRLREGLHEFRDDSPAATCPAALLVEPRAEYPHSGGDCSVTGGYVYRGEDFPELGGIYLYGDFCSGRIRALPANGGGPADARLVAETGLAISTFGEGNDGELYVVDIGGGGIYRIGLP